MNIIVAVLGLTFLAYFAVADDCDVQPFVDNVNQEWIARDYPEILALIDARLSTCTNDILALGIKIEYFGLAVVNLSQARSAASNFLAAVQAVAPEEITSPTALTQYAISIASITVPTNYVDVSRTSNQVEYVHRTYSSAFPRIERYVDFVERLNQ
ncbi:MAG TPA: hypothetical protein DCZ95_12735 [Verrucomicrobia bacterium]|nr:hypothetical protein [Verrucomicrobiota bacterium]